MTWLAWMNTCKSLRIKPFVVLWKPQRVVIWNRKVRRPTKITVSPIVFQSLASINVWTKLQSVLVEMFLNDLHQHRRLFFFDGRFLPMWMSLGYVHPCLDCTNVVFVQSHCTTVCNFQVRVQFFVLRLDLIHSVIEDHLPCFSHGHEGLHIVFVDAFKIPSITFVHCNCILLLPFYYFERQIVVAAWCWKKDSVSPATPGFPAETLDMHCTTRLQVLPSRISAIKFRLTSLPIVHLAASQNQLFP